MSVASILRHLPILKFIPAKQGKMHINSRIDSPILGNLASHATSTSHTPLPDCLTHNLNSEKPLPGGQCESDGRISGRSDPWYDHRHLYLVVNDTLKLKWIVDSKWRDLRQCLMPCDDRWDALTIELARLTFRTNVQLTISFDWRISNTIANQTAVFALGFIKFILIICIAKSNPNPDCWTNMQTDELENFKLFSVKSCKDYRS